MFRQVCTDSKKVPLIDICTSKWERDTGLKAVSGP